jgi:hypothetical protein
VRRLPNFIVEDVVIVGEMWFSYTDRSPTSSVRYLKVKIGVLGATIAQKSKNQGILSSPLHAARTE